MSTPSRPRSGEPQREVEVAEVPNEEEQERREGAQATPQPGARAEGRRADPEADDREPGGPE